MRQLTAVIIIYFLIVLPCRGQENGPSNHIGMNVSPIYDMLNMYPENQIRGGAVLINYGNMVSTNLSFGINLFYSDVSNKYNTKSVDSHTERQEIKIIGISPNLRYHFIIKKKLSLYIQTSIGFGNYNEKTTNLMTSAPVNYGDENESVFMMSGGIGMNYFLFEKIALDFNVPYVFINRLSSQQYAKDFHTIIPMIGILFYW